MAQHMHDSLTLATQTTSSCRYNPLSVGFSNVFEGKHNSWVHRTWKSVRGALLKHGFLCTEDVIEPETCTEESSLELKFHQGKLEVLSPFERHILLCWSSKQPLLTEHMFLSADEKTGCCMCAHGAHGARPRLGDGNPGEVNAPLLGMFLPAYAKEGVNLAHRLMDGKRTRRRLHTVAFARLQGEPGMIHANAYQLDSNFDEVLEPQLENEQHESLLALLHRVSLKAFKERIHATPLQELEYPNKEMLDSVQDFFLYTEFQGRQVFEELDRDADGKLTIDDVKLVMKKMKLPACYAKDFMQNRHWLWPKKSFRWSDFSSMIQEKEPLIVRLFNSLGVSKSGTVSRMQVKDSLKKSGLLATEANVCAMMKFLAADTGDDIKYGQFRRFMLLLPTEQLSTDPWNVWLKAATVGGEEPSSESLQDTILKYITSLPRTGSRQERFEAEALPC